MAEFPDYIFREYDIRGVATEDEGRKIELTEEFTEHLGRAFGSILRTRRKKGLPRIVVGRDARRSGEHLETPLEKGLMSVGVDVIKIGQVPTPCTYFAEQCLDVDGAIQITGSHNPVDMNGFKMLIGGAALYGNQIQHIYEVIKKEEYVSDSATGSNLYVDFLPRYIDRLVAGFEPMPGLKLVADCANGTSGPAIQPAFERLGIDAKVMFPEPDGSFPNHHADPTVVKNLVDLQGAVKDNQAWLGVAFDGDSDRLGAVDENGNILWGDQLMIIFARDILERKPGSYIVGEVKCSKVLYDEIAKAGGIPEMYKTGHSLIKKRMKETGAVLAGEMSGHLFFQDRWMGFDDANYAALRLAEIVFQANKPLGEIAKDIPRLVSTPEIRVDCPENIKFKVVKKIQDYFRGRDDFELNDIDGARVQNEYGWGLVRASNTQAVLVLRFEADTEKHLDEIREMVESAINKASKGEL